MSDTWGKGAKNNTIGWGSAACTTTNDWGKSQKDSSVAASWSGDTDISGCSGTALSITYSSSAFCEDASDPTPTVTDNVGAGTFSSTAGLVFVSTSTGEVDISASTSGATYVITYTDTDAATATFSLTINDLDNAAFSYSQSSYSPTDADPTPTITGLAGGTFSAGSGLVFVDSGSNTGSSTGEINLSASTVASYTITYDTASSGSSVCPNTSTQSVEIASALAQINNVYSMDFDGVNGEVIMFNNSIDLGVNSTISLWANFSSTLNFVILGETSYTAAYLLYINATEIKVRILGIVKSFPHSISLNQWYNIVIVRQGDSIEVFQNGNSLGTQTGYASSTTTKFNIIGSNSSASNPRYPVNGFIDEVGLFNTVLTAQEVLSIYNATEVVGGINKTADLSQLTTPPVKWYRM